MKLITITHYEATCHRWLFQKNPRSRVQSQGHRQHFRKKSTFFDSSPSKIIYM